MLNLIELKNNKDYFLPLSKRPLKGVYFYRFIGYDDNILKFLKEYEASVKSVEEPVQAKTKARTQNREKVQTREASAVKRTTRATTRKEPTVKIVDDDEREM